MAKKRELIHTKRFLHWSPYLIFYKHDHKQIQSPVSPKSVDFSVVKHREHVYMYISSTYQNKSSSAHSD